MAGVILLPTHRKHFYVSRNFYGHRVIVHLILYMKVKIPFLTIIIYLLLLQCDQPKRDEKGSVTFKTKEQTPIDTSIYAVLPYDTSNQWIFKKANSTVLSSEEIIEVEKLIQKCIDEHNIEQQKQFDTITKEHPEYGLKKNNFVIDLTRYKRQYFPVINDKGEKEVWVNCFCNTWNNDWRKNLVFVFDGGNCYFNLKVNLTKEAYYELMVNGDA
jgi:hypothetical protein